MVDHCIVLLYRFKNPWQPAVGDESDSMSCGSSLKVAVLGNVSPWLLPPLVEKGLVRICLVSLRCFMDRIKSRKVENICGLSAF